MKMNQIIIAIAAAACFVSFPRIVVASDAPVLNDYILKWHDDSNVNCDNQRTTYEINVCAGRHYKRIYRTLVAVYDKLYAAYDISNKNALQTAQIAWERYVTTECAYETTGTVGGTIHSTMVTNCEAELTRTRIDRLQMQANCKEGDISCNHP